MMISVKKVFISSNSRIICLPCPLPRGRFLIQESAVGGLSYYTKKRRIATTLLFCSEDGARERCSIICCTFSFC